MSSSWLPSMDEGGNVRFDITPPEGSAAAQYSGVINAVPEFIANELLGIDDATRAFRAARTGDWNQFARSLLGFAAEGGLTALSLLAAPVTGGASVAARTAAAAGRGGVRSLLTRGGRQAAAGAGRALMPGVTRNPVVRGARPSYRGTYNGVTRNFPNVPLRAPSLDRATRFALTGQPGVIRGFRATPIARSRPGRLILGNRPIISPVLRAGARTAAMSAWEPAAIEAAEEIAATTPDGATDRNLDLIDDLFGPGAGDGGGAGGGGGIPGMGDYRAIADRMAALLPLGPTEQELAYLEEQLLRLDSFQRAGDLALESEWAKLEKANYAAAEKAVQLGAQFGPEAKQIWSQVAQDALLITQARGEAAGIEGGFEYTPSGAAADFANLTGIIGQSEADLATSRAATAARDLEWLGATAASTGTALRGQLQNAIVRAKADEAKQFNQMILERDARRQETLAEAMFSAEMAGLNAQASAASAAASRAAEEPAGPGAAQAEFASYVANLVDNLGVEGAIAVLVELGFTQDDAAFFAQSSASVG